jgi:prepilin-type N-terminal cleavage/methylation domain-containing protein
MKLKSQPAFTLLETIIVLFVVAIGMTAVLSLTVSSLRISTNNRNTLVAYHLAEEGIELIQNVRDSNWLGGYAFDQSISDASTVLGTGYVVDYANFTPVATANMSLAKIQNASPSLMYLHNSGVPDSIFSRLITIYETSSAITISSVVEWKDRGGTYQVELDKNIYDWNY